MKFFGYFYNIYILLSLIVIFFNSIFPTVSLCVSYFFLCYFAYIFLYPHVYFFIHMMYYFAHTLCIFLTLYSIMLTHFSHFKWFCLHISLRTFFFSHFTYIFQAFTFFSIFLTFFFFFNIPLVYLIYSSVFSFFLQECLTWIFRWSITMEGDSTSARPPSWCSSGNRIHITWRKSTPDPSSSRYYKNWKERTWSR